MTSAVQYLLDTDMCIYLLNGDERVKSRVAQVGVEAISVSILTVGELYFGKLKAALRRDGKPIGDVDLLIAGVAASHGLKVVTNNTEHFERIADISLENWLGSSDVSP